jgi:putative membrane protein
MRVFFISTCEQTNTILEFAFALKIAFNICPLFALIFKTYNMTKIFTVAVAATCFLFACKNDDDSKNDSVEIAKEQNQILDSSRAGEDFGTDDNFLVEAASGGMMEVQLGDVASKNAASAQVKEFGRMMVADHSKANAELTTLARLKNIAIPNEPGADHQKHIDEMKKMKAEDFDKHYMSMMTDDHEEDVKKFEKAAKNAKDEDVRAFAAKTLPVLKMHLEKAKAVKDGLKD